MGRGEATRKKVIVAWATECKAAHKDVSHLQSNHEEADIKIIHRLLLLSLLLLSYYSSLNKLETWNLKLDLNLKRPMTRPLHP